jgi:3-hydroxyacyl-[acyl-carrier-protein] dehydratase
MAKLMSGAGVQQGGVPLLSKVTDIRFRMPVYPGDTVTIEVKRTGTTAGFHFISGRMKNGDKKVMNVEFAVAWKTPEGQVTTA